MIRTHLGSLLLAAILPLLVGCATEYHEFPRTALMMGNGGEKTTIHGIDLWTVGLPPRRFEVIGLITDSRPCGMLAMCTRASRISSLTREHGGDALILKFDQQGIRWHAPCNGSQGPFRTDLINAPIQQEISKYFVIRYL